MEIRHATEADFRQMMRIYQHARAFMEAHGNPNQWGPTNWPPEALIHADIEAGSSYVCTVDGRVIGTFFFQQGREIESTYRIIENGAWLSDTPYGVIHRLAGDGTVRGVGSFCIDWAFRRSGHLRVDTHGVCSLRDHLRGGGPLPADRLRKIGVSEARGIWKWNCSNDHSENYWGQKAVSAPAAPGG